MGVILTNLEELLIAQNKAMFGYGGWVCILNIMQVIINDQKP